MGECGTKNSKNKFCLKKVAVEPNSCELIKQCKRKKNHAVLNNRIQFK